MASVVQNADRQTAKGFVAWLKFGVIHRPDGFGFSNAKDPAGNSISISSRRL